MLTDAEIAQRAKTVAEISRIRQLIGGALYAELREGQASAESADNWDELNNRKWFAYEAVAAELPGGEGLLNSVGEEAFLRLLNDYDQMTSYQMSRALKLPW